MIETRGDGQIEPEVNVLLTDRPHMPEQNQTKETVAFELSGDELGSSEHSHVQPAFISFSLIGESSLQRTKLPECCLALYETHTFWMFGYSQIPPFLNEPICVWCNCVSSFVPMREYLVMSVEVSQQPTPNMWDAPCTCCGLYSVLL